MLSKPPPDSLLLQSVAQLIDFTGNERETQ